MTTPTRSGIPTTYRGTNFRSRLEARWAAFFDLVDWSWVYEPLDADGYIPDFLITGPSPLFVEVGPCITPEDYVAKAAKPAAAIATLRHDVLVVGASAKAPFETWWEDYGGPHGSPGWLGEFHAGEDEDDLSFGWGAGVWTTCVQHEDAGGRGTGCGGHGVSHNDLTYFVRPCRHYPGGRIHEPRFDVDALWAEAGNRVQWRRAA